MYGGSMSYNYIKLKKIMDLKSNSFSHTKKERQIIELAMVYKWPSHLTYQYSITFLPCQVIGLSTIFKGYGLSIYRISLIHVKNILK
jgi:hypothetical protein